MSTISDEQKRDPFYSQRKKELRLTDEYMEIYASSNIPDDVSLSQAEKILRRLYHTRWLTAGKDMGLKDIIKLIMLKIPYATADSLTCLSLFESPKNAGVYISKTIQSEKNKNGFVRTFPTLANRCRKVYTLTNAAKQETLSTLPEATQKYLSPNKSLSAASNVHDAFCCNLYYFLLADFNFPEFFWLFVPYFNLIGTFSDALTNMKDVAFHENTDALRPDAFINTIEGSYYFVGQDMITERAGRLSEKFQKYARLFATMEIDELNDTTILFSVFADTKPKNQSQKMIDKDSGKDLIPSKLRRQLKEFSFYICVSEKGMDQSVTVIEKELTDKMDGKHQCRS